MSAPTDEDLMERVRSGDAAAFALLVRRYESPLFNYLRRYLANTSDAEDMFQEAFLKVHIHRQSFREGARFKPWLYQIATNLARDRLRYLKRRRMLSLFAMGPSERPVVDTLPATGPLPDAEAEAHETAQRLQTAIAKLPEKHRAVFLMARYDDMPYADIAVALGIPEGTVKSRMNTAVKALMAELGTP